MTRKILHGKKTIFLILLVVVTNFATALKEKNPQFVQNFFL